jgi:hypothetical protein
MKKWTGASLVDLDEKDNQLEPAPLPLKSDNKWLIRGAVVLAAAALIVGLQLLRRRFAAKG